MDNTQIIFHSDGSVFHLGLKPGEIAPNLILVGDPGRVKQVMGFFDVIKLERSNREFHTATGSYRGMPVTVISTGIGTDNIDIVLNELDLLVNYDTKNKSFHSEPLALNLVRIGTSGSLQDDIPPGTFLLSSHAIGTEGLLRFYELPEGFLHNGFSSVFEREIQWPEGLARPYLLEGNPELYKRLKSSKTMEGITISANGFYGPQGRSLRLPVAMPGMVDSLSAFRYNGLRITNFEMETSAIFGLSSLMGHRAAAICAIIANRKTGDFLTDYKPVVDQLIEYTLNRLREMMQT